RYDDPADLLARMFKVRRQASTRLLVGDVLQLKPTARIGGGQDALEVVGPHGDLGSAVKPAATFADDKPAMVVRNVGKGRLVHYSFFPGMSYYRSGTFARGRLPEKFADGLRARILEPVDLAGVMRTVEVDRPFVETPVLVSDAGAAVTVLNWNNDPQTDVALTVRVPFAVNSVTSVRHGPVKFTRTADGFSCTMTVGAADILVVKK
ncbi:hypothetical protein HQ590_06505, partial [bacterium]|nr:hypothetical protein [bacterium]